MVLQVISTFKCFFLPMNVNSIKRISSFSSVISLSDKKQKNPKVSSLRTECFGLLLQNSVTSPLLGDDFRRTGLRASRATDDSNSVDVNKEEEESGRSDEDGSLFMDEEERLEWRRKIREVIAMNPDIQEETDPAEMIRKTEKLKADYPLVMEEEDPDWPEEDGWGFKLGQFFDKITIKNNRKADDENYDSDKELVWMDDNYIRPIKDITTAEWEEAVFKDISPLVVLVHNRYRRPKENEKIRDELEQAVHIIWNCSLPSPRCVAIDAVVEHDLVSALQVSTFPEMIFIKSGKILYREKVIRTADELSRIMAFFYFGAAKPPCLNNIENVQEVVPCVTINNAQ
ncbi:thioredoxin-like fold domain-containing protein MRL7L, chloroplastic [Malania oleifera]|uniref:thioredoxin-like fold domain-containing protein MRL7L, chloroplastic n=1 Tax=Malania oleifera TaxID=397392 RepID=UPI0025AE1177|nr:thioredoxin-like fold domain-containing protein MRL7L, chloroplastic [Malania oleifera]XP_057974958.1 thioredoxin-like fold domain-containing protein MRL7L, chloroplastic [Malania oleifera]XP_057974959.1 thioredoxin-like fold domain-containing protein MRL7L, chloroplastic [Malania oleifera]XP_057974960.1 thioredoxin-like fold domain-containing protein MRL7L, chloroplastic [Malania oleifera]XP_057974961.1 thioredoxin-like fold domain-containing protein MRL7L, chloroplastic [Malania oleifera]